MAALAEAAPMIAGSGVTINVWAIAAPGAVAAVVFLGMVWRGARRLILAVDALLTLNATTSRMDAAQTEAGKRQQEMLEHLKTQATEQAAMRVELRDLHDYAHEGIHAIRNNLQKLAGTGSTTELIAEQLGIVAQQLRDLPGRDHQTP